MKKLIFTLLLALPLGLMAQPPHQMGEKMTPEQHAVLKAKAMRLHLDLTTAQEEQIKELLQNQIQAIKAHREKAKTEKLSDYNKKLHHLEQQLALQEKMKSVLTKEQFEKWKSHQERKKHMAFDHRGRKKGKNIAMKKEGRSQKKW